jgi:hypothetical protein
VEGGLEVSIMAEDSTQPSSPEMLDSRVLTTQPFMSAKTFQITYQRRME